MTAIELAADVARRHGVPPPPPPPPWWENPTVRPNGSRVVDPCPCWFCRVGRWLGMWGNDYLRERR